MTGRRTFIGNCRRSGRKPACISDAIARACARAAGSLGHKAAPGIFSARYSRIASDSQTRVAPSMSTGTLPAPLNAASRDLKSAASSEISVSSNGIPATFIASQGRNDQEE